MHRIIEDGMEDYLAGRVLREFDLHLEQCSECRVELEQFGFVSTLFREAFEAPAVEVVPSPGFYARVAETLEGRKAASPWAFFSIDAVFGRRVAFASLLALALVGGFLISRESEMGIDLQPGPDAIIAQHDAAPRNATSDATVDRDRMMITLASYDR